MDKNVLKKFAIESRQELMDKISNKIKKFYVDEEFQVNKNGEVCVLSNEKHTLSLTKTEYENRQLLIKRINEITLEQVIEESAYTWFNRIIAIRYMEIHDYLPLTKDNQSLGIRVLSSKDNTPDPEIMKISNLINSDLDIAFDKNYYSTIQDNNKRFEYILLLVCKKLGKVIPQVFDGITDYIDILIPDNLLNDSGYITKLLKEVPEINFEKVEIIGWLYQYYNQTEKDRVMAKNSAYDKTEIPFATQLFTPDWIVKYMVENSLGNISKQILNKECIEEFKYDINSENIISTKTKLEEIKVFDPCCGSGHILVYLYDILYKIYLESGYQKDCISELILKNNLYGTDIDNRAWQLSVLSIMLKARESDKDIFKKKININIIPLLETSGYNLNIFKDFLHSRISDENLFTEVIDVLEYLITNFENAKEIGSLNITKKMNYKLVLNELNKISKEFLNIYELTLMKDIKEKIIPIINQAILLSTKYDCIITNPPYMSSKGMSNKLKKYIDKNYKEGKSDLFAAFIICSIQMLKENGYLAMITMQSLMFLSSYNDLRSKMLDYTITSLIQIGYNSFPELNSQVAHAVAFVLNKSSNEDFKGKYFNLNTGKTNDDKEKVFLDRLAKHDYYLNTTKELKYLPNKIFAYWLSDNEKNILNNSKKLDNLMYIKQGLATGNNELFVRLWHEVNYNDICFNAKNKEDFFKSQKLYAPYNKGGNFRKWYGNKENLIKFNEINYNKLMNLGNHLPSREFYFKKGITWSLIGNENFAARISDGGFVFDVGGSSGFPDEDEIYYYLAFLCSKITVNFLKAFNPTINFQVGDIKNLPILNISEAIKKEIIQLAKENVEIVKTDWDSFETSWEFKKHPLFEKNTKISDKFNEWENITKERFIKVKNNEEKINEIFIKEYNLTNIICPTVNNKDISIRLANKEREIKSLLSYIIGCLFGRFSTEIEGVICTDNNLNLNNYNMYVSYDKDNVIPITDTKYFDDDLIKKIIDFIEIMYGKNNLNENLEYISDALGKRNGETNEDTIRRYIINDFYNDHIRIYQKKPLYWMFNSGKNNGFKCLIYMHRYNERTVSKIRLDYLHKLQNTYEKELKEINDKLNLENSLTVKKELTKKQIEITAKLQETNEYDEKIAHIADQKISIDLDDGVVVNYAKFSVKNPKTGKDESILAKIK